MKLKKPLSLMLALCMMVTVLLAGMVTVSAEEPQVGSWKFSDIAADNVTSEQQAILDKALDGLDGVDYKAVDVIASQIVSGTRYAFLCIGTPVVPNAQSHWSIVTAYVDPWEDVELVSIADINAADVQVKDNVDDYIVGGWNSTLKESAAPVPAEVQEALENNPGLTLSPIAVLGTQVVAGTNYCILAYGTTATADPVTSLYRVIVYTDAEGSSEITAVDPFDLTAYISLSEPDPEEPDISEPETEPEDEPAVGSWKFSDIAADNVTSEQQAILDKALENMAGSDYKAVDVIAEQVVAGTNYAFLCIVTPVVLKAQPHWAIVTVYADLQGNAELVNVADLDPSDVKVKDNTDDNTSGGWSSAVKETAAPVSAEVQEALENHPGLALSPIAVLGTQVVAGTNYCILAYGTSVTADPVTNLYRVIVYTNAGGSSEITAVDPLDLAAYVTAPEEEPIESSIDTPSDTSEYVPPQPDNGLNPPKTGYADTTAIVMLVMVLAFAGMAVSALALSKKRD